MPLQGGAPAQLRTLWRGASTAQHAQTCCARAGALRLTWQPERQGKRVPHAALIQANVRSTAPGQVVPPHGGGVPALAGLYVGCHPTGHVQVCEGPVVVAAGWVGRVAFVVLARVDLESCGVLPGVQGDLQQAEAVGVDGEGALDSEVAQGSDAIGGAQHCV